MITHNTQSDRGVSKDAVRYLPVDSEALGLTSMAFDGWTAPVPTPIRETRNAYRVTLRRQVVDVLDNIVLAIAVYLDNRHHRRSR